MAHIEHKNKSEYYFADDMWTFLGVALLYEYGNPFLELLTIIISGVFYTSKFSPNTYNYIDWTCKKGVPVLKF